MVCAQAHQPPNENELDEVSAESSNRPIDFPSEVRTEVAHGIVSQRESITAMEGEILRVTHTRKAGGEGGDSFTSSSTFSSFPLFFSFARYDHTGLFICCIQMSILPLALTYPGCRHPAFPRWGYHKRLATPLINTNIILFLFYFYLYFYDFLCRYGSP